MKSSRVRIARVGVACMAGIVMLGAGCGDDEGESNAAPADTGGTETTIAEDSGAKPDSVTIKQFRFQPDPIEVSAGSTVTWTNGDDIAHTVTAGTPDAIGAFDEALPEIGATAEVTFDEAGTFQYFCARHPSAMKGSVVVT